jgi:ribosome-associated translation inhibitor RaiA
MMQAELSFHGLDRTDSAEASVLRWIARIEQLHDGARCGVTIDRKRRHHEVRVKVEDLQIGVVSRARHENLYVAIADAFRAIRRQLQLGTIQRAS